MELALVLTTYADMDAARSESRRIVTARLAACASLMPVTSVYEWDGQLQDAGEVMAVFKTTRAGADALREAILEGHTYDTPEVIVLGGDSAGPYMDWVAGHVGSGRKAQ